MHTHNLTSSTIVLRFYRLGWYGATVALLLAFMYFQIDHSQVTSMDGVPYTDAPSEVPVTNAGLAQDESGVVRAVLFWSETCPHCHLVIDQILPPLQQKYSGHLQIKTFELSEPANLVLFDAALQTFHIPPERQAVPFLFVGDMTMVGSDEISTQFPAAIVKYLGVGGTSWPDIPGLGKFTEQPVTVTPAARSLLPSLPAGASQPDTPQGCSITTPCAELTTPVAAPQASVESKASFSNGFEIAIVTMGGMVSALLYAGIVVVRQTRGGVQRPLPNWRESLMLALSLIGLGVAVYLAYVEVKAVPAACGPVGDCNQVQTSPYARLFGVLPIGVLGMVGYMAILVLLLWKRFRSDWLSRYASQAITAMTLFGVVFSIYLTYIELAVITAVCAWCLTSAIIMTMLLVLSMTSTCRASRKVS